MLAHTEICLYLDFYGTLLTGHCRSVLEMHFAEDMSLGEIAQNLGISRQAVHDRIRQGMQQLAGYELALGLIEHHNACCTMVEEAMQALDQGRSDVVREKLLQLKEEI